MNKKNLIKTPLILGILGLLTFANTPFPGAEQDGSMKIMELSSIERVSARSETRMGHIDMRKPESSPVSDPRLNLGRRRASLPLEL